MAKELTSIMVRRMSKVDTADLLQPNLKAQSPDSNGEYESGSRERPGVSN